MNDTPPNPRTWPPSFWAYLFGPRPWLGFIATCLFACIAPFLRFHPKLRLGWRERLGGVPIWPRTPNSRRIWLHGASAGDVQALLPTIQALKAKSQFQNPLEIVVSTTTNSGYMRGMQHLAEPNDAAHKQPCKNRPIDRLVYAPWDIPWCVHRSFNRLRPDLLLLEYAELWPQWILAAHALDIPVVVHNGRLSKAKMGAYTFLFAFTGNLLARCRLFLARSEDEALRAQKLGCSPASVVTTGNTKHDSLKSQPSTEHIKRFQKALSIQDDELVWVAGSTHEGEENIVLDAYKILRQAYPNLRLILAPRYITRSERIAQISTSYGFQTKLRSHVGKLAKPKPLLLAPVPRVWILDTMGELSLAYHLADIAFVGGSFISRGGQNILEAAAAGIPVLFGPNMENFADAVTLLLGQGGIRLTHPEQLQPLMHKLLGQSHLREDLGANAARRIATLHGAAKRNADLIDAAMHP